MNENESERSTSYMQTRPPGTIELTRMNAHPSVEIIHELYLLTTATSTSTSAQSTKTQDTITKEMSRIRF